MQRQVFRSLVLSTCFLFYSIYSQAQPVYVKVIAPFTGVAFSEGEWIDLDNDNDLDLIQTGQTIAFVQETFVYENSNGTFTLRNTALPAFGGSLAAGDYDKDGDADILISGNISPTGENISAIFRNDGGFVFTKTFSFQGLHGSQAVWFDADNDEALDFIITGLPSVSSFVPLTLFYKNTGSGFVQVNQSNLPNCWGCVMDIADGNGDGKMDVMLTGVADINPYEAGLYVNNGDMTFRKEENIAFKQVNTGAGRWGDFDGDGDMDISLTGMDSGNKYHSLIYGNGNGQFQERADINLLDTGVNGNGTLWFDYNNDGKLDLLTTGRTIGSGGQTHRLYKNNGEGSFTETLEPEFDPLDDMSLDAGDFDNDGDLDISFQGYLFGGGGTPIAGYFKNTFTNGVAVSNTKPQPPSSATFTEKCFRKEIRLMWGAGSDAQTPANGLSYNFYLRDALRKIILPSVDFTTGYLRTTNPANGFGKHGFAYDLVEGELYYAVQSIDGAGVGSVFSTERNFFHLNGPESIHAEIVDEDQVKVTWLDHSDLETSYNVARSTSVQSGFLQVGMTPTNTVTYTDQFNFLTETYYYYRINGTDGLHTSAYDSLVLLIPERPTNLESLSINASTIQLTWNDNSNYETGFRIERRKSGEPVFEGVTILPANTGFYEDLGLEQGTLYDYRVRAISVNGGLPPIEMSSVRTNYLPLGVNFSKESPEDTQAMLSRNDFESHFTDSDLADQLVRVKIIALPLHGILRVAGIPAFIGQELIPAELDFITFEPEVNFAAITVFSVYPHDGKDYSTTAWTIILNIQPVNDPPAFDIEAVVDVDEDFGSSQVAPTATFIPYELNDVLTYSITPDQPEAANVSVNPATGAISWTSVPDKFGEIEFTLTADDGQVVNSTFSKNVKLVIHPVNDPPVIGAIEDVQADAREALPPITIAVTDVDNVVSALVLSASSSNQNVLKNEKVTFFVNASDEVFMTLVPENFLGVTVVTVMASDGVSSTSRDFGLEVFAITEIENNAGSEVSIFPNPVAHNLIITIGPSFPRHTHAVLRDVLGRELKSLILDGDKTEVNTGGLLPGIYFLDIAAGNGTRIQKKVIKQ